MFLPTRIYATIGSYPPRWGEASALSLVLVALTVAGLALQRGYLERRSYITVGGRGVRTKNVGLGAWRWPLLAFCLDGRVLQRRRAHRRAGADGVLQELDRAAFGRQLHARALRCGPVPRPGLRARHPQQLQARNALRPRSPSLIGAAVAYLDLRTTVRGRRLLDYLAILPLGLPGTVMAVGILLAFIRLPVPIYGTIWILLAAYVARFVPLATRSANATFRQIDPSLEEAGRVTGATWWHAIRRILFPLSRPGLLVAFLLVFIPAFSELSATILLYTGGTETIAIAIYRLNDLGQLEVVSALAVFTIAVVLTLAGLVNLLSGSSWTSAETPPVRG